MTPRRGRRSDPGPPRAPAPDAAVPRGRVAGPQHAAVRVGAAPPPEQEMPKTSSKTSGVSDKELQMAQRLVDEMVEPWEPEKYHDLYGKSCWARSSGKAESGGALPTPEPREPAERGKVTDMMTLLKQSVARATGSKPSGGDPRPPDAGARRPPVRDGRPRSPCRRRVDPRDQVRRLPRRRDDRAFRSRLREPTAPIGRTPCRRSSGNSRPCRPGARSSTANSSP
jgi:hypothetical protein